MNYNFRMTKQVVNADKEFLDRGYLRPLKLLKYDNVKQMQLLSGSNYYHMMHHGIRRRGVALHKQFAEKCETYGLPVLIEMYDLKSDDSKMYEILANLVKDENSLVSNNI